MRKYDGKDLFVTYCGWGAAAANKKLVEYAKSKYGAGSQMGPSYAMWRWAWENPEEAFPIWKEYFFERFPEEPQPTFDDFVRDLLRRGEMNRMIAVGGTKGIHNFCAKYGLKTNYGFEPGDVAQIIRRGNPLFQARHELSEMFFGKHLKVFYDHLAAYIHTRIEDGAFRPVDPLLAARAFIGVVVHHRLLHEIFGVPLHQSHEDTVAAYVDLFLTGLIKRPDDRKTVGGKTR